MKDTTRPKSFGGTRVLVAGGGVAALEAMLTLRALAAERVDIELVAPEPVFFYRPLSVVGGVRGLLQFELSHLADAAAARLTLDELVSVDPAGRLARTRHGAEIRYDFLILACGALPRRAIPGALTFRGPADREEFARAAEVVRTQGTPIVFAIAPGVAWPLPIYELAFALRDDAPRGRITIRTAEHRPLEILGRHVSDRIERALEDDGIELVAGEDPRDGVRDAEQQLVVSAPLLEGQRILGIPADYDGFVATTRHAAVHGVDRVYAAGDVTDFPVKQGSIAAAQADAASEAIAAEIGVDLMPELFRPILHAAIAVGKRTIFARRNLDDPSDEGTVSDEPLWSPPAKIAARRLAPVLAELAAHPPR
jgi:sulfide:quinone oxidoreductase